MASKAPRFRLTTFYRSSCSGRLRIACNLKNLGDDVEYVHVALHNNEQHSEHYRTLNPSRAVPVLTHLEYGISIPQSVAALEYLEEILPEQVPLLPPRAEPHNRAKVRTLVNIIACDVQPITNRRVLKAVGELGGDTLDWSKVYMTRGLESYEKLVQASAGRFSVGDAITLADVCLVPACWTAEKHGVNLDALPTVKRIYEAMSVEDAVVQAHWSAQKDTPADLAWL